MQVFLYNGPKMVVVCNEIVTEVQLVRSNPSGILCTMQLSNC